MNLLKSVSGIVSVVAFAACGTSQNSVAELNSEQSKKITLTSVEKMEVRVSYLLGSANQESMFKQVHTSRPTTYKPQTKDTRFTLSVARLSFHLYGAAAASMTDFNVTTFCPGMEPQTIQPHSWGPAASWDLYGLEAIVVPTEVWKHSDVVGQIPVACRTELAFAIEGTWHTDPFHAQDAAPKRHNFVLELK